MCSIFSYKTINSKIDINMKNRYLHKNIKQTKVFGIGQDRPSSGFGYAIIPYDMSRNEYISRFKTTGLMMIVSDFNEPINNVIVPEHLIDEIKFPLASGEYGSLVSWFNVPVINQIVVNGTHKCSDQLTLSKENVWMKIYESTDNQSSSVVHKIDSSTAKYTISTVNNNSLGGISLNTKSQKGNVKILIKNDGKVQGDISDSVQLNVGQKLVIEIGSDQQTTSTLEIDESDGLTYKDKNDNIIKIINDKITIDSNQIDLGSQNMEPLIKGDQWKVFMQQLINIIKTITVTDSSGTPTSPPLNQIAFDQLLQQIQQVLSTKSKTQ